MTVCFVAFTHAARFRQQYNMEFGYIKIVDLPRGARNVNITELTSTRNYLGERSRLNVLTSLIGLT